MKKRGPKPKGKVLIEWSPGFAYALGLLVTDGCISGSHIVFVSKDQEQLENFTKALRIQVPFSYTKSGSTGKMISRVQFGDVLFCEFLQTIGVFPNKTKTIGPIDVPTQYFFDFLRGHLDGDGCIYSYTDKRWKRSFMFYTTFVSASQKHILWLQKEIEGHLGVMGHISTTKKGGVYQLRYAKQDSVLLWGELYPRSDTLCLSRKRLKIEEILRIISEKAF